MRPFSRPAAALFAGLAMIACVGSPPTEGSRRQPLPSVPGVPASLLAASAVTPDAVSLIQLIGTSASLDGKRVQVVGFAHVEFEGQGLYLHREDCENLVFKNAVWLDVPLKPEVTALNDRYVLVEGTFRAGARGHFGNYSGALVDVSRYDPMPSRQELTEPG